MKKLNKKVFGSVTLSFAMIFTSFASYLPTTVSAAEERAITTYQQIGRIESASKSGNVIDLTTSKEKIRITFLEDGIFRLNMEQKNNAFVDKPVPRDPSHTAEILDKQLDEYAGPASLTLNDSDATAYVIETPAVTLKISKTDSKMELINKKTGKTLWKEKEPLMYKDNSTVQTLETDASEYFYGGGMTNGYFSHKGTSINIVKNPNKWTDGYPASPNPFYMSSKGYGVMRYTWMEGVYDFGEADASTVKTSHAEDRFDAFYYVEDPMDITSLIHDFTEMTGEITLLPEYAFYLGHLNCYSRDTWNEDPNGRYKLGTSGKRWSEVSGGSVTETLMGEDKPSAQSMLQSYLDQDMPIGYLLPNDGYGCGYGRENTLDGNVANLKTFADFAKSQHVETGLWTQSRLTPDPSQAAYLQRDLAKEVQAGTHLLKTDVAWVGPGYSMALSGIKQAAEMIEANSDYRRFIISLDGWAGTQRYAGLWSGDQTGGNWEYIRFHIPTYIGSGLSGNPNVGSDQDGIWGNNDIIASRDYQWKSFTPLQLDMDGWAQEVKHPGYYDKYAGINRMYLKMKAQMLPYIYTISREAMDTSKPMIRAMLLEYPNDPYTYGTATQYQYMWGPNMLIAPVYRGDENDAGIRNNIYLPDENQVWIDYFTGKQYQGGQILNNFSAPEWKTPVFIKNGAIIPMTEENNSPSAIAVDATRTFEVWPSGETSFKMYEDDGYSQEYKKNNAYAFTTITSSAPVSGDGTAKITVKTPEGNYAATGNSANRATEFVINMQKEPGSVKLTANGTEITGLREVTSQADYDSATEAVYFYNEDVNLNKYEEAGSNFTVEIKTNPKLYVKTAKMDITTNEIAVEVTGFNNTEDPADDGQTVAPAAPTNVQVEATDAELNFTWDEVSNATTYEVRFNGDDQPIIKNIKDAEYLAENLEQDTEYPFAVRAVNSKGASAWTELTAKTKLDRYRNVPKNMTISWTGDGSEPKSYAGKIADMIDNNNATEYSSADFNAWIDGSFTIDMQKVYTLEKIEYNFRANKGNGAVDKFIISYTKDGRNWTDVEWSNIKDSAEVLEGAVPDQRIGIFEFDEPIDARYLKFTVKSSTSGMLQAYEVRPYKVDKTEGYILGDYSENGALDDGDLVFMGNYIGNMKEDSVWEYTGKADQNGNGILDGYDLAYLLCMFNGGNVPTTDELRGGIIVLPEKTSLNAGETMTVTVTGVDFSDVYAFSTQLKLPEGLEYVPNSAAAQPATIKMENYSKLSDSNGHLMIAFSNMGSVAPISGNVNAATFEVRATKNVSNIELNPTMANVVSSRITEKDALMRVDTSTPTDPQVVERAVDKSEFRVKLTNDELPTDDGANAGLLFQGGSIDGLFNGNLSDLVEFKHDVSGNHVDGKLPSRVKLPLTMNFEFREPKIIKEFTVYNRNSGTNGRVTKIKAIGYEGNQVIDLGQFDAYAEEYKFTNSGYHRFDRIEIVFLESIGNVSQYPENTNSTANGNNRMLTLREISFTETNYSPVQGIELNSGNDIFMPVGGTKGVLVKISPNYALNKNVKIESSNPNVASIVKMANGYGDTIYMIKGLSDGGSTITATSLEDGTKTSSIKVNVAGTLDLEELQLYVDKAKAEPEDYYTPESWAKVVEALTKAEDIINNPDQHKQSEVNTVVIELSVALANLEVFKTDPSKMIPQDRYSGHNTLFSDENAPDKAFDGNKSTYFESPYSGANAGLPANFTIKLDREYIINQVDLSPWSGGDHGKLYEYEVQVSMTGEDADFRTVATGSLKDVATVRENKFPKVNAQYVRIKMLSGVLTSCARFSEIQVYGEVPPVPVTGITLNETSAELLIGKTLQLSATLTPTDTTETDVTWTSSDETIATVDVNGLVTAVKEGKATITATVGKEKLQATAEITVISKEVLQEAVDAADAFVAEAGNEAKYTAESWAEYLQVLADAKDVLANDAATNDEIVSAAETLNNAKEDVLVLLVSKDELIATIAEASAITNGTSLEDAPYTAGSYQALQDAIADAQAVVDNDAATEKEISEANHTLAQAMKYLVEISELRDLISELSNSEGEFTVVSKQAFDQALAAAEAVLANPDASSDEVTAACDELQAAYDALVSITELKETIDRAEANKAEHYTEASYQALLDAIANAKDVLAKEDATAEEVQAAIEQVEDAEHALIPVANKNALQNALDQYAYLLKELDEYPSAAAEAFKSAYAKAEQLNNDKEATQVDVDQACKVLIETAKALENYEKPNPDDPDKPVNPGKPNNSYVKDEVTVVTDADLGEGVKLAIDRYSETMIKVFKEKIKDQAFLKKYNFEKLIDMYFINSDGERIEIKGDINMVVSIKLDKDMFGKNLSVVYISDDGVVTFIPSWIDGDSIKFKTTHNSNYAIVSTASTSLDGNKPTSPIKGTASTTGDHGNMMLWITVLALAGSGIFFIRKKKEEC